ncbi:hypothetical protein TR13x_04075 [Caloranaerobacter sp. TR13]|uniref:erythromycin esterase family protein n=1 Tax=Caloranaerobacter sp. TR13 TaxID=1302151 RepID=UPI0006D47B07|nr:erythromycin esterase family protein [Caloranaerobacter sp. TR13]KPU27706.1 hypothetical protein TR13x_04075 [Caloranaerobacter sp. TR13]
MKPYRVSRFILLIVIFSLITSIIVGCTNINNKFNTETVSDDKALSINSFLEKNSSSVDLKDGSLTGLSIFDNDIDKYDVFLAGESHAIAKNYDIQLALLKYFNQKADVRYLLGEMGYSKSAFINEYMETGNEELLELIYRNLKGTASWNKESYEFWKKLRKYNMTLPENKKIKVIGIDIEHQVKTALIYLYSIIPNREIPESIKPTIERFKNSKNNIKNKDELRKLIHLLRDDMKNNEIIYKEYFGDKFFDFSIVVDNIENSINAYEADFDIIREQSIYDNFKRVYNQLPKGKYFGQWGLEHVYQRLCHSYMDEKDRFAMYLNRDDSPVKDKVLSIAYGYINCFRMTWGKKYGVKRNVSAIKDIGILNRFAKTDITIFRLIGTDSPFNKKLYFVKKPIGGVTTDYFQYVILIKDSKGTTPFDE